MLLFIVENSLLTAVSRVTDGKQIVMWAAQQLL